jgi:hypothetical protein
VTVRSDPYVRLFEILPEVIEYACNFAAAFTPTKALPTIASVI